MTNTLFPTSQFSQLSSPADTVNAGDLREFLRTLNWKKGIEAEVQELLREKTLKPIALKLQKGLSRKIKNGNGLHHYNRGLLWLLDYLAIQNETTPDGHDLSSLLRQLIENNDLSRANHSPEQQISAEIWLAELSSLLAHEWSQVEADFNSEISRSKLIDLYLLAQLLLLGSNILTDELFLNIWVLLYQHLSVVKESVELPSDLQQATLEIMITQGELPCLAGVIFGESLKSVGLFRAGKKRLVLELNEMTDTDGTPHASLLPVLPHYFACVLRTLRLAKWFDRKLFSSHARSRWESLIKRAAAITDCNAQLNSTSPDPAQWKSILCDAISNHSQRNRAHWARQCYAVLNGSSPTKRMKPTAGKGKKGVDQTAATNSAWAHLACLRNNWYPGADLLRIAHHRPDLSLLLSALGQSVFDGRWQTELKIDGQQQNLDSHWTSSCWFGDETGDFLELRNETETVIIDRQIFLSRTDHIALLSDTVFAKQPDNLIELRWELPLAGQWKEKKRRERRELFLKNNSLRLCCIPLGLPQDRVARADGVLEFNQNRLCLNQTGQHRLTMPLFLDWSPARKKSVCDWNRLTVTENRTSVSASDAFAARCRIGKHQWLYLRNMEFSGLPRAVLGMHTDAESVIAEFPSTGIAERLVEVHYDEDDQ